MSALSVAAVVLVLGYVAVCFGKVAAKHGKNPILYGILSVISPVNMVLLGYWAFSDFESRKPQRSTISKSGPGDSVSGTPAPP